MKALSTFLVLSLFVAVASAGKIVMPPQGISRWTHYPTWRVPTPGWDAQQLETVIVFSMIAVSLASLVAMKFELFVKKGHIQNINDTYHANSRLFSTIISFYIIATLASVVGFWVLDLGKLWGTIGALHNLLEVTTLLVMTFSRYTQGFKYFYPILFFYFIVTEWTTLILQWPYDAIFFKFQGLATDAALVINFVRLYRVNKAHPVTEAEAAAIAAEHPGASSTVEEIEVDEDTPLINNGSNSFEAPRHKIFASILPGRGSHSHSHSHPPADHSNENSNGHSYGGTNGNAHPTAETSTTANFILLLVLASSIHFFGNTITTLSDGFLPFIIFQFSYGIAYPIYAYYVALVPDDSRIRWFNVSIVTEAIVAIVSIVISGVVIGISTFLLLKKYQKHDLDLAVVGY